MGLNKLSAFETKCENKLLGQGDAVEHQFHAWARDERRRATHSPAQRTRWKLPVVISWCANPDNCAPKLSSPGYIEFCERRNSLDPFSAHSSWPRENGRELSCITDARPKSFKARSREDAAESKSRARPQERSQDNLEHVTRI